MSGGTTTNAAQEQQQTTQPFAPTLPLLNDILGQYGGLSTSPTPQQQGAVSSLYGATTDLPNFAPQGTNVANNLFNSTATEAPLLNSAYQQYQGILSPYLSSTYTNPMSAPGMSGALGYLNNQITNQVNDQFAAAGRDLSPANTQALATGLSQGEGQLLTNEYNTLAGQQLGAAGSLFGAGGTTAGGLTGLQQTALGNQVQGLGAASTVPGLATQPAATQLSAATQGYQLPYSNLGVLEQGLLPISALGSQSQGTTSGTTTLQQSPLSTILGGTLGGLGLLGGTGAFGSSGYLNPASSNWVFSDERVKKEIEPVGMLYDGLPVYSYKYRGDDTPRIGLLAQDVEQVRPDAVAEFRGVKAVDYSKATERARHIGLLHDLDMAA